MAKTVRSLNPYPVWSLDKINKEILPPREWLVPDAIDHPSLGMVIARRGMGKTWFALHLALSVAHGTTWAAPFRPCPKRGVIYFDGEMSKPDIFGRLQQLEQSYSSDGSFWLVNGEELVMKHDAGLNLSDAKCRERVVDTIRKVEDETPVGLIVLDNWSSLVFGLDENSNSELDDIRRWMVRLRHLEVSVLLVHHVGKGEGQRGASAREDQLNYTLDVSQIEGLPGRTTLHAAWNKCRGTRPDPDQLTFQVRTKAGRTKMKSIVRPI